jgi:hypothetical protein
MKGIFVKKNKFAKGCEIRWIDAGFSCKSGMIVWPLFDKEAEKLKVIGNIYENPKLLIKT